jgi:transcription initiation factor TFIID subunit 9B
MSNTDETKDSSSRLAYVPRDARLMALILQSMGVQDVQPPALMMLLEFANRYLHEVLQDALVYADHANSSKSASGVSNITVDDVQLAIQSRVNYSFTSAPNKDALLSLASSLNGIPLPPISDKYGVKLPPAQHCLTNVNFSIVPNPPPEDGSDEDAPGDEDDQTQQEDDDALQEKDENDDYDEGDETVDISQKDEDMADTSNIASSQPIRGIKRSLEEEDDYD